MEILISAHERLTDALTDLEAKRAAQEKLEALEQEHSDALKRVNHKIAESKNERGSTISSKTGPSNLSSKGLRTTRSRTSNKTSRSSSTIDRKTETAVKLAKLKTELDFAETEAKKISDLKKFQLTKELAIAEAEMNAISTVEERDLDFHEERGDLLPKASYKCDLLENYLTTQASSVSKNNPPTLETEVSNSARDSFPPKGSSANAKFHECERIKPKVENFHDFGNPIPVVNYPSTLNPFAQEHVAMSTPANADYTSPPLQHSSQPIQDGMEHALDQRINASQTNGNILERLADLMTQRHTRNSLPLPEPETFHGDVLHYPLWKKSTDSPSQRLYYLGRYTSGEAKEAISGLLTLESEDAYRDARKTLADRYGNPFLVANAYKRKIKDWPPIPPNDGTRLRKFSDFLGHCHTAMQEIQYLTVLNDPDENHKILRKLPRNICDRWGREVDRWFSIQEQEKVSGVRNIPYPPFSVFYEFLKREARIACNPVTMMRVEQEEGKAETSQQKNSKCGGNARKGSSGAKSFATGSEEMSRRGQGGRKQPERCRLCKNDHNLDECDIRCHSQKEWTLSSPMAYALAA